MTIEPFKYLVQPVAIERDQDGHITREVAGETVAVYSLEQATALIERFELELAARTEEKV
jgi:hypothetical protein